MTMDEYGFETRLRHLEHVLVGQQNNYLSKTTKETILKRVELLQKELDNVYKSNKTIKDFVIKYDAHSKVLNPSNSMYALEREVLAPDVKLELILAAQDDLEKFSHEVKQVKELEHVVGGSSFGAIETLGPKLSALEVGHTEQVTELNNATKVVSDLMERYNGTINTLSEIFISWDSILTSMETHITTLEHQKSQ